jgi:ABC-2 type transport system permease protein
MSVEWIPIFWREMLLFRRRLLRLGYLFSAMVTPIIYLIAFGLGLGTRVQIGRTDYLSYLIPGLVAMSSMNNSYTWVASSINLNRVYFKTFQIYVQAPIHPSSIMIGEVLAGMIKGLFASALLIVVGLLTSSRFFLTGPFWVTLMLNCFLFSSLGVITGMLARSHEDTATYSNFFIMPMAFFSGTFFPVDHLPAVLKWIIYVLPLTHANIAIRQEALDSESMLSLLILVGYAAVFFLYGSSLIRKYSE